MEYTAKGGMKFEMKLMQVSVMENGEVISGLGELLGTVERLGGYIHSYEFLGLKK